MAKNDAPAFRMTIERGKLVPSTAFDAERLDTYRSGATVRVRFVEENDRIGIRKWWAILSRAVKDANTPWENTTQASEAIKLALGIVNLGKTAGGAWMQYPRSLTELDDPELDKAVINMMALLHKITGIDPAEWRKESADVGREESQESSPPPEATSVGGGDQSPPPGDPAPDQSAAADLKEDGAESNDPETPSSDTRGHKVILNLKAEAVDKFMAVATDKNVPDPKDRRRVLELAKDAWKRELPNHLDFVKACLVTADAVIKGEMPTEKAREYLAGLVK